MEGSRQLAASRRLAEHSGFEPDVSVVIPAYNEEGAVAATVESVRSELTDAGISHEIIVVNDGSSRRYSATRQAAGATVVNMPHNGGYGRSLKAGIAVSTAPLIAILDADGTYPASYLPEMIAMTAYNDMVVGDRGAAMAGVPLVRRPAKWVLNRTAGVLAGHRITDLNSGLRLFRREALEPFISAAARRLLVHHDDHLVHALIGNARGLSCRSSTASASDTPRCARATSGTSCSWFSA